MKICDKICWQISFVLLSYTEVVSAPYGQYAILVAVSKLKAQSNR